MKFGKYLATRQLELPEYSTHFINYKALKKLINTLASPASPGSTEVNLQEKKGSFFFRLERELEKVNDFYIEKESELRIRLDILREKKTQAVNEGLINSARKNSIAFSSLYDGFKKYSKDLDRLEQFVELNEVGFAKVLKKWDKRSKSETKEVFLTTAVNVQPVFHRHEIVELRDLVGSCLYDLEANMDGDLVVRYEKLKTNDSGGVFDPNRRLSRDTDQLYSELVSMTASPDWQALISSWSPEEDSCNVSKLFLLLIRNVTVTDEFLHRFYHRFEAQIDLSFVDDLTGHSCLHEAAGSTNGRQFIVQLASKENAMTKDASGRLPLHYAAEMGRADIVRSLALACDPSFLDLADNDSMTPIVLAIIQGNVDCVRTLIELGVNPLPQQDDQALKYLPLNVACKLGEINIVQVLLEYSTQHKMTPAEIFQFTAEGLSPIHIASSCGHHRLLEVLVSYGANVNSLDKLNKWTPIFYSASQGFTKTTAKLIELKADFELKDEDGFSPLYYAAWYGNLGSLNLLSKIVTRRGGVGRPMSPLTARTGVSLMPESSSLDIIPNLSLPPPIIPLRKYGHNFLEKKIFLKLSFFTNRDSIKLFGERNLVSAPGRIALTCGQSDIIPRNLILPIANDDNTITFQVDSLHEFSIDFELFPTFGTRLIAKATLPPDFTHKNEFQDCLNTDRLTGDLNLPLYDARLRNIGELRFNYQVIYPYSGKPLEISMYDTYWKSTNNNLQPHALATKAFSFVTSSSLSGEYFKVKVCMLNDGTPFVCPNWQVNISERIKFPITNFSRSELDELLKHTNLEASQLSEIRDLKKDSSQLSKIMSTLYMPLSEFLSLLPTEVSLDLEIFCPTPYEVKYCDIRLAQKCHGIETNGYLNGFLDGILTCVFENVRKARSLQGEGELQSTRSLIFSSTNSTVCTALNWKQPNYPVFYSLNGVRSVGDEFVATTANGLKLNPDISRITNEHEATILTKVYTSSTDFDTDAIPSKNRQMNVDHIDSINKDAHIYTNELMFQDWLTRSIKIAIHFAISNNLLGMMVPKKLLDVVPEMSTAIKSRGLILVASEEGYLHDSDDVKMSDEGEPNINGWRVNDLLNFSSAIDM